MAIKTIIIILAEIIACALLHKLSVYEQRKDEEHESWAIIDGEFIDFEEELL